MTAESFERGEGLRHPGHPTLPQPGNETPAGGRPRARAAGPTLRGTGANSTQRHDPRGDQRAGAGARLLPQGGARRACAPGIPAGAR